MTAVLLIIFNRPNYTEKTLAAIRNAKPAKLYIAADGPRQNKAGEKELCEQTRNLVLSSIDWECEVKTLFQEKNLGCALGVSTGISWFFKHEEQGIILEDDIVANLNFFKFCDELLQKYKYAKNVWTIGGYNPQAISKIEESYCFTKTFYCWGWATWRDRWKYFSFNMKNLKEDIINWYTKTKQIKTHHAEFLWMMQNNMAVLDTWAYPYFMHGVKHKALHILPQKNMIKNIGNFGRHINETCPLSNMKTYKLDIANEPKRVKNNQKLQDELDILLRIVQKYPKISSIKNRKIYLWGTGEFVWKVLFFIKKKKIKIIGFLDNKQKKEFWGCKVELPEHILNRKDKNIFIFIASIIYAEEMAKICEQYGLKEGVDFWRPR